MSNQKPERWQIEAQRKSDAKDRLSERGDDGGVLFTAEAKDPLAGQSPETRAAINAYASSNQPGSGGVLSRAVAGNGVSLKDAGDALVSTASLPSDHPDRMKAVKDWDAARSRGDSIDSTTRDSSTRGDATSQRVQRWDSHADSAESDSIDAQGRHPEGRLVVTHSGQRGRWVFDSKYNGQVFYPEGR